jgi:hypothetical protein
VKYVVISKLAPGVDNATRALQAYAKAGLPPGTESTWAGVDGKTFITVVDTDAPDMATSATYAPFMDDVTVIPVVAVDDAWMTSIQAAQANWG